jgi:hypothetical protein
MMINIMHVFLLFPSKVLISMVMIISIMLVFLIWIRNMYDVDGNDDCRYDCICYFD